MLVIKNRGSLMAIFFPVLILCPRGDLLIIADCCSVVIGHLSELMIYIVASSWAVAGIVANATAP